MKNRFYLIIGVACVLVGIANQAAGAARTASVTGNWNNTATWGGAAVPTSSDDITINAGITVTMNVAGSCTVITSMGNGASIVDDGNHYALTLQAAATITASFTATISCPIAGAATSLTKSGSGTLILSGTNTYAGTTTISTGILNIQNGSALGGNTNGTSVSSGARLQLQGGITVGVEALTINGPNGNTGLQSVSGSNTYNGTITLAAQDYQHIQVDAGSLALAGSGRTAITGSYNVIVDVNGTNTTCSIAGNVTNGASYILMKRGVGTLYLSGSNNFGHLMIRQGSVSLADINSNPGPLGVGSVQMGNQDGNSDLDNHLIYTGGQVTATRSIELFGNASTTNCNSYIQADGTGALTIQTLTSSNSAARTLFLDGSSAYDNVITSLISNGTGVVTIEKMGSGTWVLTGANTYTGGSTLTAGTLKLSNTAGFGAAGQALRLNGGILDLVTALSVNAYNTTVGGMVTINSNKDISGAGITHILGTLTIGAETLIINKGANVSSGTAAVQFGNLTLTNGATLSPGTANLIMTGTESGNYKLIKSGAGTLQKATTGWTLTNDFEVTAGAYDSNGQITTVTGLTTVSGGTYSAGSATQTFTGGLTISGGTFTGSIGPVTTSDLLLNSGTLTAPSGTFSVSGNWTKSGGTFTPGSNTITFTKTTGTQNLNSGASSFYNISHGGAGVLQLNTNALTTSGTIINASGAGNFDANNLAHTVTGLTTITAGSYLAGTATQTFNGGLTINGGTFTGAGGNVTTTDVTLSTGALTAPSGSFNVSGNWTKSGGTFTPGSNTVTFTKSTGTQTLNSGGSAFNNISHTGAGILQLLTNSLTTSGTFINNSGAGNFDAATNNLAHTVTGLTTFTGGSYLAGTAAQTLNGGLAINGGTYSGLSGTAGNTSISNVTLNSGTLSAPGLTGTFNVSGDWTYNTGSTFTPNGGTVTFNSTSADQNINGTATTQVFNNLTVSKSSNKLIIGGSTTKVTVGSTLTMTSGNIDCGSSGTLELGTSTSSVGTLTYTAGNILGNFKRWIRATGTGILFPVGTAADNRKALVTFTNLTSGSLTGKFIASDPGSTGLPLNDNLYGITHQFTEGYWSLISADALVSTNYAIELTGTNFKSYVEDANVRIIKRSSGGSWSLDGTHVAGVSSTAKRSGLRDFSEFGHGRAESCLTDVSAPTPSTQTVCNNTSISSISVTPTGGTALTYQWYSNSTNNTATGTSLGSGSNGEQTATYTPPATTTSGTTYYYCVVSQPGCNSINSTTAILTVNVPVTYGSVVSGDQTICYNGTPSSMSVSGAAGSGSFSYQWYSKSGVGSSCPSGTSTSGWNSLGTSNGANTATYTPATGITSSTTFACFVTPGGSPTCGTATWATGCRKVTVNSNFTAGEIASTGETICYNGDPAQIGNLTPASGGDESITYTWQRSKTSSLTGYSDITGSNSVTYDPPANLTETTWYRRQAKDGTCNTTPTSSTSVWKVTVYADFTAGAIETIGESICYSGNPLEIGNATAASGGNESITYQWQSSLTSNFASPTNITSSNSSTYDPPTGLVATTWYRRQAKDGACNTSWNTSAGTWKVTVVDPDAPTGTSTQTYCSAEGKTVTDLTATLVSGINIKWYSASTGGTQYQNSDVLVSRSYFASQTNGDGCESTTRKEVAVTINANPNLTGLSSSPTNVCQEDPSVVTVSATSLPNGTYTVNYTLTGDNAQGATDIQMNVTGGTNSGTFSTPDLTNDGTTTVTINSLSLNSCPTTATSGNTHAITITATGTWLGTTSTSWNTSTNWCGGVPGSSTNVVVPSASTNQPHVDITTAASDNLTINSGAVLTIDAANALTVNGTLTNSAGNNGLILKSDGTGTASLVHITASVPATVERYISGSAEAWHFLSSPVASQSISGDWIPSGTYGNGTGYDLYVWDEVTRCWIYKLNTTTTVNWNTVHSQGNFVPGRGYLYSVQATNHTKSFGGNLNNGSYDYPITLTTDTNRLKGFNLVGNPYPSSVDWQATSGWGRSNLVGGNSSCNMWVWSPSAGNYGLCSSSGGSGTNGVTRYIAPMQGFFVQAASSGNLGFSNSIRVHDGASDWKSARINPDTISAIVQSERDQTFDEVRLLFGYPEGETGAAKLFSPAATAPSLYLDAGSSSYTVRYLTDTIAFPHVPVQFKPGTNGNYTLSFNFNPGIFNTVMLEDRRTKKIQDLKIEPEYRFRASVTDEANRFVLHFASVKAQANDDLPAGIFTDGTHILVDLAKVTGDTRVLVYDVLGQKLYEQQFAGETQYTLNFNPGSQLLIIQLQNPKGQLVRKIVCNSTSR